MTTEQACELLQISRTTLYRRIKAGTYKVTKGARYTNDSFTYADLGLPEPEPDPIVRLGELLKEIKSDERPTVPIGTITEPRNLTGRPDDMAYEDSQFARDYKAGLVGDSTGNLIDGTNPNFPSMGIQSLIGVPRPEPSVPLETQAHMDPALITQPSKDRHSFESNPEGFTRRGVALCAGLSQETYDQMMRAHDKRGGKPSMSEQAEAVWRAEETIRRSFPRADRT